MVYNTIVESVNEKHRKKSGEGVDRTLSTQAVRYG